MNTEKIMLLKFDNFLRVVVTSANLYEVDWDRLGQFMWYQEFDLIDATVDSQAEGKIQIFIIFIETKEENDFGQVLKDFFSESIPVESKDKKFTQIIRGDLNLDDYNFTNAQVIFYKVKQCILGSTYTIS